MAARLQTPQTEKRYVLDDFVLELDRRALSRAGAPVHLPNRPFKVLLYLIEHRHRMVSRAELLDRFWEGREVYDATLTKCVGAVRRALGDDLDHPRFIKTRWAEGYRYIGPLEELAPEPETAPPEIEHTRHLKIAGAEEPPPESASAAATSLHAEAAPVELRTSRRAVAFTLALVVIALAGSAFVYSRNHSRATARPETPAPIRSIAVLPLKNLSNDPAQEYFSDGVTESLMTELTRIRDLKVIARNSSFAFKGKETDVREIGQRLGVGSVLEGALRRDARTVRLTIRLISTEDRRVLWTGDMTRPLDDLLKLQDEIGCGVAETLKTVLCSDPNHRPGTNNLTAYSAYLKARDRRLKGDPKQAADLFQQAADADPNYALAWAGLAEACTVMEVNSLVPPRSMTGKARECALKAIALDASLAAPYAALGLLAAFSDRDWATGERYFQQALANNPNYAIAHAWYANTLLVQGKFAEAEAEYWRAHELDPLNPQFFNNLAETCHYQRQSDRCLAQAARALELDPGNQWARFNQAKCYTQAGRYEEALRVPLSDLYKNLNRFCILALSGRQAEARKLLPLVLKDWGQTSPYVMGIGYMCLGDKETAFVWLQKAAEQQQADLVSLKIDPAFEPLRDDPRYAALLRRVGLSP